MTFPTTDLGFSNGPINLLTECGYFYPSLEQRRERTLHGAVQFKELAGVRLQDFRDGTGLAQISRPPLP